MRVAELIEELKKLNPHAVVMLLSEGGDYEMDASHIKKGYVEASECGMYWKDDWEGETIDLEPLHEMGEPICEAVLFYG